MALKFEFLFSKVAGGKGTSSKRPIERINRDKRNWQQREAGPQLNLYLPRPTILLTPVSSDPPRNAHFGHFGAERRLCGDNFESLTQPLTSEGSALQNSPVPSI